MKLKFKNGGTVKLQNKGKVPNIISDHDKIVQYNLANGTHFYNMDQVMEHDAQKAASTNNKRGVWDILSGGSAESPGEAILNRTIETANNAELPETRSKIYNDTGKAQLATTAGSLLTLPMLGEFSTYGLLGGASRLAGGFGGSAVGSYTLGKAGELGDKITGTKWMRPTGQIVGGLIGWVPGSNIGYNRALNFAIKHPFKFGNTIKFISDAAGRMSESMTAPNLNIKPLRHVIKTNLPPDYNDIGAAEYELFDTLTGKNIGNLSTTFDLKGTTEDIPHVWNVIGSEGNRGVSRALYNAALIDKPQGLISGENLLKPEITEHVWTHFPREVVGKNMGTRPSTEDGKLVFGDVVRLKQPETFIPTLTENKSLLSLPKKSISVNPSSTDFELSKGVQTPKNNTLRYYHDGKWDINMIVQDYKDGKKDAIEYLTSDLKKNVDLHNVELANRIGLKINPEPNPGKANTPMQRTYTDAPNTTWIGQPDNGFYITVGGLPEADAQTSMIRDHPELDQIIFNHYADISDKAFHEFLHRGELGAVPHRSAITPEQQQIAKNTGKFYKWKTKHLLKPNQSDEIYGYLEDPRESAVNIMEIGRRAGLSFGQKYPGKEQAKQIISNIINNDSNLGEYLNRTVWESKPKRVWDALTGKYYATIPFGTGLLLEDIIKEPSSEIKTSDNAELMIHQLNEQLKQGGIIKAQNSTVLPTFEE